METRDPLIDCEWLQQNIAAPDIRVVDATWFAPFTNPPETGRAAYNRAHIEGAVYFDLEDIADTGSDLPHMLPDPVKFSSRVRKLGIGDGNRIVIYDQNRFFASARAWWMLRVMGHKDVHVLDGGLDAWVATGRPVEDVAPVAVERHFTPRVRAGLVMSAGEIAEKAEAGTIAIIDARPDGRFHGREPEPREGLRSGHIPGSVNLPGSALITEDGHMKPAAALTPLFADPGAPIVTTCGSGVTASITALALARLGNWDVAVYDGSWTDWASDPARPVAVSA